MTIPMDKQYWSDYVRLSTAEVYEAVQLTEPTVINGKQFESGDWSMRSRGEKNVNDYWGMTDAAFRSNNFHEIDLAPNRSEDRQDYFLERLDDLIVEVARLAAAMQRHGIVNDSSQK